MEQDSIDQDQVINPDFEIFSVSKYVEVRNGEQGTRIVGKGRVINRRTYRYTWRASRPTATRFGPGTNTIRLIRGWRDGRNGV